MSNDFELAFRQLLKAVIREVAVELLSDQGLLYRKQSQQPTIEDGPFLLSSREAAKRLSISERHLFSLTKSGGLPCVRVGTRVLYSVETIKQWIRESEASAMKQVEVTTETGDRAAPSALANSRSQPAAKLAAKGSSAKKATPVTKSKPKRKSEAAPQSDPKNDEIEDPPNPFSDLLNEIGVSRSSVPPQTNGGLRRIAEVDIATFHGWMYLKKELPEAALNKLRKHFRAYLAGGDVTNEVE